MRYFFITNQVAKGDVRIEHCPTDMLLADYYSKPLQGEKFRVFRNQTLNINETQVDDHLAKYKMTNEIKNETKNFPNLAPASTKRSSQECVEHIDKKISNDNKGTIMTYCDVCK